MKKEIEYNFCMGQFKPAICGLAAALVLVLGWTTWHYNEGHHRTINGPHHRINPNISHQVQPVANRQYLPQYLGMTMTAVPLQPGMKAADGILVNSVVKGSPADKAGIRSGDIILRAGNVHPKTARDLTAALGAVNPGSTLQIKILKGTRTRNVFLRIPQGASKTFKAKAPNNTAAVVYQPGSAAANYQPSINQLNPPPGIQHSGRTAIASTGPGLKGQIAPQFDTSPWFVIFDPSLNNYNATANPNATDAAGQGVQTAQFLVDQGVCHVVGYNFSREALGALNSLRVNISRGFTGTVMDVFNSGIVYPQKTGQIPGSNIQNNVPAGQAIY